MFNKPREGREPELNIFIDQKFNVWNLPDKAKVVLVSNLPQVCLTSHVDLNRLKYLSSSSVSVSRTCFSASSHTSAPS